MKHSKPLSPLMSSLSATQGSNNSFSLYFQAHVQKELCWMVSSTLKYVEHVAFDRTIDKESSLFEFFVAPDLEEEFLDMMHKMMKRGIILDLEKLPNRLINDLSETL